MSAGFDRSLLEGKDRDELIQIATALGEKPPSRAKKADIIALVLRAAGVEDDGGGDGGADPAPKPKRATRARKTTSDGPASDAGPRSGQLPLGEADGGSGDEPQATGSGAQGPGGDEIGSGAGAPGDDATAAAPSMAAEADDVRSESGDAGGNGRRSGQAPQAPTDTGRDAGAGRRGGGRTGSGEGDSHGRQEPGGQSQRSQRDQQHQGGQQHEGQRNRGGSPDGGDQGRGNQQDRGNQGRGNQQDRGNQQELGDQGQGQGDQQGGGQPDPNNQQNPNQSGQQGQNGESESANKRRRRRGRDRDRQGGAQGQGGDDAFVGEPVPVNGLLDLRDEGYGFLRLRGYLPSRDDVYVSVKQARQSNLRKGDHVAGTARPAARNEKNPALHSVETVNGQEPEQARQRPRFEDLTPLFPDEKLRLEAAGDPTNMTTRIIDLIAPIGKGQRGLIVSPPKAGKTTVMKHIARSIEDNNPDVQLIVLLVDERPEEVTDMKRWLKRGEVAASTFDRPSEEHTQVSELVIERAKRMVEEGRDVVIILDGITRLARAYNLAQPPSGRVMSGGIDAAALYPPKRFFGAARNVEEGGSLTILATALVETNSRMDEHIFEEFKGTGNMELKLDRRLADRRIYPAIDVEASSTRREELLFDRRQLQNVWKLRRVLSGLSNDGGSSAAGLELLIDRMRSFKSNDEFLTEIGKAGSGM